MEASFGRKPALWPQYLCLINTYLKIQVTAWRQMFNIPSSLPYWTVNSPSKKKTVHVSQGHVHVSQSICLRTTKKSIAIHLYCLFVKGFLSLWLEHWTNWSLISTMYIVKWSAFCLFVFVFKSWCSTNHSIQSVLTHKTKHVIESPTNLRLQICQNHKVNLTKIKYI